MLLKRQVWSECFRQPFELLGRNRFHVQRYCVQEKCQVALAFSVGGLDGSLTQIFSYLQNWGIPSALSDLTLVLFFRELARKTVFSTMRLKGASQEGKELKPPPFKIVVIWTIRDFRSSNLRTRQGFCPRVLQLRKRTDVFRRPDR